MRMRPGTAAFIVLFAALAASRWRLQDVVNDLGPGFEPIAVARTLATEGRFANPFGGETGPTAQQAPAFPVLLAAMIKTTAGTSGLGLLALILAVVCALAAAVLLPILSFRLFKSPLPGLLGACWMICIPTFRMHTGWPDASVLPLSLIVFCLLPWSGWRLGAVAGVLAHINPSAVVVAAPWYVAHKRRIPGGAVYFALGIVAVCVPWATRNYCALGGMVPMRSDFNLSVRVSNNDAAQPSHQLNGSALRAFHPTLNDSERAEVLRLGELEYMRRCGSATRAWIRRNPRKFLSLTLARIRDFWFPPPYSVHAYSVWILTVLSFAGLVLLWKHPFAKFAAITFAVYPLPFYITNSDARYRYPILWISALLAGYALAHFCSAVRTRIIPPPSCPI